MSRRSCKCRECLTEWECEDEGERKCPQCGTQYVGIGQLAFKGSGDVVDIRPAQNFVIQPASGKKAIIDFSGEAVTYSGDLPVEESARLLFDAVLGNRDKHDVLKAEIERLRAERQTLPRFADDAIAYPGMDGWYPGEDEPGVVNETGLTCGNGIWGARIDECFSTRNATEAAGGNDGKT